MTGERRQRLFLERLELALGRTVVRDPRHRFAPRELGDQRVGDVFGEEPVEHDVREGARLAIRARVLGGQPAEVLGIEEEHG